VLNPLLNWPDRLPGPEAIDLIRDFLRPFTRAGVHTRVPDRVLSRKPGTGERARIHARVHLVLEWLDAFAGDQRGKDAIDPFDMSWSRGLPLMRLRCIATPGTMWAKGPIEDLVPFLAMRVIERAGEITLRKCEAPHPDGGRCGRRFAESGGRGRPRLYCSRLCTDRVAKSGGDR
jgi:hypothetical protein